MTDIARPDRAGATPDDASASHLESVRVRRSFDRAASSYDQAAALQRRVADQLLAELDRAALSPSAILDAGCGTGYGTAALAQRFAQAQLYALDIAPAMLNTTSRRVPGITPVCADVQDLSLAPASLDLAWSSLMLQWCNRTDLAFAGLYRSLRKGGRLLFSTFGPASLQELRTSFSDDHTHVSRFTAMDALQQQLLAAGFSDVELRSAPEVLYYPDVRSLMLELKAIGAHNATAGRPRGLTGKQAWQTMLNHYEEHRVTQGLPATYEILYASAIAA